MLVPLTARQSPGHEVRQPAGVCLLSHLQFSDPHNHNPVLGEWGEGRESRGHNTLVL